MKQLVHLTRRSYHNTFNLHVPRHGFCLLEKPETGNWNSRFEQVCVAHPGVSQSRYGLTSSRRGSETPNSWTLQHEEDRYQTCCCSRLPINTNNLPFSFLCSNISLCFYRLMQHIKDFHYLPCEPRKNSLNALCVLHLLAFPLKNWVTWQNPPCNLVFTKLCVKLYGILLWFQWGFVYFVCKGDFWKLTLKHL
jgi:hypothetical protein